MSIVVGKRNFAENFSKMMISDFPQDSLYRSKLIMNEATIANRNFPLAANQAHFLENAKLLKQNFQHIDEKEIVTVLDDCDNNLEIAMEILQKSAQQNFNPNIQASIQGRTLKKIQTSKDSQKKANTNVQKPEEKKLEPMREEEPVNEQKVEEVMNLSANVIAMLQSLNSMDEAQDWMARFILEVKDETEKKNQTTIKKLKEEKAILVKAFAKQRQKAHVDEVKNEELNNRLTTQDQEIGNLKMINYNLGLRLRALDTNDNENHNYDVY